MICSASRRGGRSRSGAPGEGAARHRPDALLRAEAAFLGRHPDYEATRVLDDLRAREFSRLGARRHVYLDYAGSGLYAATQVRRHADLLLRHVLGNPHADGPSSAHSGRLVQSCRDRILEYFRAAADEYTVVFTANASQALKLVGEAYPFERSGRFLLTVDNHNSVNGICEFSRARGARAIRAPIVAPDMRADEEVLRARLDAAVSGRPNLFAYPAASNFSGVHHPLEWVARAQSRGWHVLLDASAFVASNRLDLSQVRPDFVALSFYKMFGHPTGAGALIARKEALGLLRRPWFAGGTIEVASVNAERFVRAAGAAAFEDGTLDFTGIPAVPFGLDMIESVGIGTIHDRVRLLAGWLIRQMVGLEHRGGRPLVRIYGPAGQDGRGGTIAFNLQDASGRVIDPRAVARAAALRGISLRTGCFCNPGAGEVALGTAREELAEFFGAPACVGTNGGLKGRPVPRAAGAVRASLGLVSDFPDVWALSELLRSYVT